LFLPPFLPSIKNGLEQVFFQFAPSFPEIASERNPPPGLPPLFYLGLLIMASITNEWE